MKYLLTFILLVANHLLALSDEPAKPPIQVNEPALVEQALAYLKKAKPEVDTQKLEFWSVQYRLTRERAGFYQQQPDGTTAFVKVGDVQETTEVTFKQLETVFRGVKDQRTCVFCQTWVVNFPHAGSPASVHSGTLEQYGDFVK